MDSTDQPETQCFRMQKLEFKWYELKQKQVEESMTDQGEQLRNCSHLNRRIIIGLASLQA